MSLKEEVELLRRIPLFQKVEASKLKLLAFTSERLVYREGEVLFEEGAVGDAAYVVIRGTADVMVRSPAGPLKVAEINEHELVGEIAILCDIPRTATILATSEMETLRITKDHFFRLIEEFPQMAVEMMRELAHRLETTTLRLREAMIESRNGGA